MLENCFRIRPAVQEDVAVILKLIQQLAEYERLSHECVVNEELLLKFGFGNDVRFQILLAETNEKMAVGFALYFFTFSTFEGKPTLYLEDLFVDPAYRGKGVGKALLKVLADIAVQRECQRMEWAVLDWNESAIRFYQSIGAFPMSDWSTFRLRRSEIEKLVEI